MFQSHNKFTAKAGNRRRCHSSEYKKISIYKYKNIYKEKKKKPCCSGGLGRFDVAGWLPGGFK
jgi:hypothetical protein